MAIGDVTKGSIIATVGTVPTLIAQSEANDPISEDSTIAEGRDANGWSAHLQLARAVLGAGARGLVKVATDNVISVGALRAFIDGVVVEIVESAALVHVNATTSSIYLSMETTPPTYVKSTTGFPLNKRIIPLGVVTGSSPTAVVTERREELPSVPRKLIGENAPTGSGGAGKAVELRPGKGDGAGADGRVIAYEPEFGGTVEFFQTEGLIGGVGPGPIIAPGTIPAGTTVLGVTTRIIVADSGGGGAVAMDVGVAGAPTFFAAGAPILVVGGTTAGATGGTQAGPTRFAAANALQITPVGGVFAGGLSVRFVLSGWKLTASTS